MNTYILIDSLNTFFRAKHGVRGDLDLKIGMSLHVMLSSVRKTWREFNGTHVVFCCEGRSWRKDYYPQYKANRKIDRSLLTEREIEEDQIFSDTYNEFIEFIRNKTNCTVLQHPRLEADDLIAGFIQQHPTDQHIIISSDSDFVQLISNNVKQFNGVSNVLTTVEGYFDEKLKPIKDSKTGKPKEVPNPQWLLFEKCIRGDATDNIFSAFPGARKTKMLEAFNDNSKGYAWNNLMLQRYKHHDGTDHKVLDDYNRNRLLIDLTAQPDDIKEVIKETITANSIPKNITQVGIHLLKFCSKHDLKRISDQAQSFAEPLNANYK